MQWTISKEENPYVNMFGDYIPNPDESHHWGECMEDWYDSEWKKEQAKIDCRRKVEKCER